MEKDLNSRTQERHFEVDVAKACAIVFMVIVHVYEHESGIDYFSALPESFLQNAIEFLGAH
jgi:uncharacterized membrane protein